MENKKLLFLTQRIDLDNNLSFVILWVKEFMRQGFDVEVVCLQKGRFNGEFPVFSLGKEKGAGKIGRMLRFYKYILTRKYDAVFVHMNPEYITLGGWWWKLTGKPMYLWYTHYTMHIHMRLAGLLCKRMFAATKQSMPQFEGNPKKVILGHGIDIDFWLKGEDVQNTASEFEILSLHRIMRSKRIHLAVQAMALLPKEYRLTIQGREQDKEYFKELKQLVKDLKLEERVSFQPSVLAEDLPKVYEKRRIFLNMAMETIDKTMLEAMLFGLYPVTTPSNSVAIGIPAYPKGETPQDIADFILSKEWERFDTKFLQSIVKENHSLSVLVKNMKSYISNGN